MDSRYPNALDNDVTLTRVDDNITEMGGDAINGLRSAVFSIEETLGINPQGSTNDVATRLSRSLNSDGSIKTAALSAIGLVTLPITNNQIASNAGIEEVKLNLDYSTTKLKSQIDGYYARINPIAESLGNLIHNVNLHIAHPSLWGRHLTSDIDGYTGKYEDYNLQGIVSDLDNRIVDHINKLINSHAASAISVDDSLFVYSAGNVQEALDELNDLGQSLMTDHRDNQHDNGILSAQNTTLDGYTHSFIVVEKSPIFSAYAGNTKITFQNPPTGFGQILRGDKIDVTLNNSIYTYNVYRTDVGNSSVFFFGNLSVNGDGYATVYRTSEELSSPSALKAVIREPSQYSPNGTIIQIIHPSAPYIMSIGAKPWNLTSGSAIIVKWGNSNRTFHVYDLLYTFNSKPSTWTVYACANVLNSYAVLHGVPIIFFEYNNELGVAYDKEDGDVEIGTSVNEAWRVLGFSEGEKAYSLGPRRFFLNGNECHGIRKKIATSGIYDGIDVISDISENLNVFGVSPNGIVRAVSSTGLSGTFAFTDNTAHTITSELDSFAPGTINFEIYSDYFGIKNPPGRRTLYELFVDAYGSHYAELRGSVRLEYSDTPELRPNHPEIWFNVTDVSRSFIESERRIYYDGNHNIMLGEKTTGGLIINHGNVVALPIANAEGFKFRLYDGSFVNYIDLEVVDSSYLQPGVTANSIDVSVYDRISEDKYIQIAACLHNRVNICYLNDRRSFGTIGRKTIRDDFKRDYISYPTSLLRGNGVVYGFGITLTVS